VVAIERDTRNRSGSTGQLDDWLAGDGAFDWPDEPGHEDEAAGGNGADGGGSHGFDPAPRTGAPGAGGRRPDAATVVRRRRILALSLLVLVIATAIAITLATAGTRGDKGASESPATSTGSSAATPPAPPSPPASTGTRPVTTAQTRTEPTSTVTTRTTTTPTPPPPPPSAQVTLASEAALKLGDTGQAVVNLQKALATLGFDVVADGKFGPGTEAAVKDFQQSNDLTADGVVGAATVEKLNQALAQG
jgi:hypothetical protein